MSQGDAQKQGLALQEGVQKQGLALQPDLTKPDKPPSKDKVKSERQANFEKSKQVKSAKNEQNKKDKVQRQKQKEKEKEGRLFSYQCLCISCCESGATQSLTMPGTMYKCPALPCPALPKSTFVYLVLNLSGQLEAQDSEAEVSIPLSCLVTASPVSH